MPELTQPEDENVLTGAASVHEPRVSAVPPVLKTQIVELLEILRNHKRGVTPHFAAIASIAIKSIRKPPSCSAEVYPPQKEV